jgi:hypothetical protein
VPDDEQAKPAPDHDPGIAGGNTARVYNFDVASEIQSAEWATALMRRFQTFPPSPRKGEVRLFAAVHARLPSGNR